MTPLILKLALPAVQIAGAISVSRRVSWRTHPALIAYMGTEAAIRLLSLAGIEGMYSLPLQLLTRTAVVFEIFRFARYAWSVQACCALGGLAVAIAGVSAGLTPGLTDAQAVYLFRSYYYVILCAALLAVVAQRRLHPMLECARHRIYRVGLGAWLLVIALAGSFVRGGLGYRIFAYDRDTWQAVDVLTYAALIVVVGALAAAMVLTLPKRKAPARAQVVEIRRMAA